MARNSLKLVFSFILVSFLNFVSCRMNCSSDTATANSTFQSNLSNLFASMSSKANNTEFYNNTVSGRNSSDTVYGLFMCRGDTLPCGECVVSSTETLSSNCSLSKSAVIWTDECIVRYSNRYFFSTVETRPRNGFSNTLNMSNQQSFMSFLSSTMNEISDEAAQHPIGVKKYATKQDNVGFTALYSLVQCTPDLAPRQCRTCLSDAMGYLSSCCAGKQGAQIQFPSCILRYELYPFYRSTPAGPPPAPLPAANSEKRRIRPRTIIFIVVPIVIFAIFFALGCYLLQRKTRKNYKTILRKNFGDEGAALEPLQFDLTIIEAATNNFSHENRIGRGGFGEVYKGILIDGRQIAVKKLSRSAWQGVNEFKNEVSLIAKLQHKNLVAFIGFCLEEEEKILVYEYVPYKSLDYFLFGNQQQKLLSWFERYNIIGGIARGILYLHEYSRLKVIHRDLKPSNVLLDEDMNPKISDFGLARLFEINQNQGSTSRIVGTFGYMSPEYAMLGQFSEKTDVFSFGVMVLEIITGKKNASSYESDCVAADGLLSYVWIQWRDQTLLSILDPNIKENYVEIEIVRCIQIGLLCVQPNPDDRPTMLEVVSYLSNHSIELPSPQKPAFFLHGRKDPKIIAQESSLGQAVDNSTPFSINEMSISIFLPR